MSEGSPGFLARYKKWIITFLVIWAVMLGFLILTGDGGNLPFQYQVF
jgi:hypothetical protein